MSVALLRLTEREKDERHRTENSVAGHRILVRKRSADAYIRGLGRRERRDRECHVVVTGCDVCADVGIRAPRHAGPEIGTPLSTIH